MTTRDEQIAETILRLLDARAADNTICPSDAARALAGDEVAWRALMPEVRRVAAALVARGRLRVTQHGEDVETLAVRGPIRLGHPAIALPRSKFDMDGARALEALGYPAVDPVLGPMLEWVQDANWPVASVLLPFLGTIGAPLAPHLRRVLQTDDDPWKSVVVCRLVAPSEELRALLHDLLKRIANDPTPGERAEALHDEARDALDRDAS